MEVIGKIEVEEVIDYVCDICGKSCTPESGFCSEHATLNARWGYGSNKDGEVHTSHFCETCYDKLAIIIKQDLKGKIHINDYLNMWGNK